MVSMTHTMNLDGSKNKISQILGTRFASKQYKKYTLFSIIAMNPVDIVLDEIVDNMKRLIEKM